MCICVCEREKARGKKGKLWERCQVICFLLLRAVVKGKHLFDNNLVLVFLWRPMFWTGNDLCRLSWKSFFPFPVLTIVHTYFMEPPRFFLRFPFGNQELIKLTVVTHSFLALKKEEKNILRAFPLLH